MRGQYSHNTRVWTNENSSDRRRASLQDEWRMRKTTWPRACNALGYRTGLFGKYLNGYKDTTV